MALEIRPASFCALELARWVFDRVLGQRIDNRACSLSDVRDHPPLPAAHVRWRRLRRAAILLASAAASAAVDVHRWSLEFLDSVVIRDRSGTALVVPSMHAIGLRTYY